MCPRDVKIGDAAVKLPNLCLPITFLSVVLVVAVVGAFGIPFILRALEGEKKCLVPSEATRKKWESLMSLRLTPYSRALGMLESLLFFACFVQKAPEVAGGWLVFKLGCKWEVWKNIISVPETLEKDGNALDYLIARNAWGTRILSRFLVGTLCAVMAGYAGAFIVQLVTT